jgi:hypothetical protein
MSAKQDYHALLRGSRIGVIRRRLASIYANRNGLPMPFVPQEPVEQIAYRALSKIDESFGVHLRAVVILVLLWLFCSVLFR